MRRAKQGTWSVRSIPESAMGCRRIGLRILGNIFRSFSGVGRAARRDIARDITIVCRFASPRAAQLEFAGIGIAPAGANAANANANAANGDARAAAGAHVAHAINPADTSTADAARYRV